MNKFKKMIWAIVAVLLATPVVSQAAIDTDVFTDLGTDVTALSTAGFTLVGVLLVAMIGIKLVKKFANRAT